MESEVSPWSQTSMREVESLTRRPVSAALCALQAYKAEKQGLHLEVKKMDPIIPGLADR